MKDHQNSHVFVNIPQVYDVPSVEFDEEHYTLLAEYERKPRKICYVPGIRTLLKDNLCDLSNGGKIYQIQ